MSQFSEQIASTHPHWPELPTELVKAWNWLEEQGFAFESSGTQYLKVTRETGTQPVFRADLTLEGWLTPQDPGHKNLLPIAELSSDGDIAAIWREGSKEWVVLLGADGDLGVLADGTEEFLSVLAIGYPEINMFTLGEKPEDPIEVSEFAAWVETNLYFTIPETWDMLPVPAFTKWMAAQTGQAPNSPSSPVDSEAVDVLEGDVRRFIDLLAQDDDATALAEVSALIGEELAKSLRASNRKLAKHGIQVESTRQGLETFWITLANYPRPTEFVRGATVTSTKADITALLGEPEKSGDSHVRYVVEGRYVHFGFDAETGTLDQITLMAEWDN